MLKKISYLSLLLFIVSCGKESVSTLCEPKPKSDCVCITLHDPVCGCNEKIYGNSCAAECDGIAVKYKGECGTGKLLGQWQMMGYLKKNNIDLSNVTKKIPYESVSITFNNNQGQDNKLLFSGKSSINFIGGGYATIDNKLVITNTIQTKIAGTLEALQFEDEFVDNLNNASSFTIKDKVLSIKITKEGADADEMVFVKN